MNAYRQELRKSSMPKGPQGQKRPADTVANAIRVAKILTGEIEEDMGDSGKDKAAQSLGRRGGAARREKLSAERRSEIARKAAAKR
jgi:hypothetical protein